MNEKLSTNAPAVHVCESQMGLSSLLFEHAIIECTWSLQLRTCSMTLMESHRCQEGCTLRHDHCLHETMSGTQPWSPTQSLSRYHMNSTFNSRVTMLFFNFHDRGTFRGRLAVPVLTWQESCSTQNRWPAKALNFLS